MRLEWRINGEGRSADIRPADLLLDVLRESFGLTGAKPGCRNGDCGACTVMANGLPMKSCLMLAVEAAGQDIVTIEGLANAPAQRAFIEMFAFQCGYCTPGFILNVHALSLAHPQADEATVRSWLQSNICRCTSYEEIREAVYSVLGSARGTIDATNG
ncbi:(2Fe-2S)-binding protein [Cohnella lubricantis]|uniref:(2Fe-2S)-binding protein n=1 Tax=Cohnella lubricantis TaxID=2163172 RepID=A0A841TAX0_9BACL|nr:(2Fe-2S)-binding protein [Cohnella lubricantis]MBB6678444.1 (2Fe-2S)-binding protein [Cohnella lubricantis]MBP2116824.1 carbon-monoxide dehydrogenase small subunit [Cohnella lubricantis]